MTTRIFKTYLCNLTFIFISAIGIENSYSLVAQVHATAHYDKTDSVTRIQLVEKTTTSIKKIFVPPSHFNKKTKEDYLKNRDRIINEVSNEISHYAILCLLLQTPQINQLRYWLHFKNKKKLNLKKNDIDCPKL